MDWGTAALSGLGIAIGVALRPWFMSKLGMGAGARPEWYRRQETLQRRRKYWNFLNGDGWR